MRDIFSLLHVILHIGEVIILLEIIVVVVMAIKYRDNISQTIIFDVLAFMRKLEKEQECKNHPGYYFQQIFAFAIHRGVTYLTNHLNQPPKQIYDKCDEKYRKYDGSPSPFSGDDAKGEHDDEGNNSMPTESFPEWRHRLCPPAVRRIIACVQKVCNKRY